MAKEVCVVTGASSGLGKELAEVLCARGYSVWITARRKQELLALKKRCLHFRGEMHVIAGDLTDASFREKLIRTVLRKEGQIDFLFNNAGMGRATRFEDQSVEGLRMMTELNVVAGQHLSALALPAMLRRGKGRLIQIGSVVAFTPLPYFTTYNATKAAVYTFNRSLRYELVDSPVSSTVVLPARMSTGFAEKAYEQGHAVEKFNRGGVGPRRVAEAIVRQMDSGREVITPTWKAWLWYTMRYFGFFVDFVMKRVLGPKEREKLADTQ
ncbi:hypothetical protein CMI48_03845 [Candidatus Pacearchaeota archaeon]|jgi:hypothetical protein|nr:hypothetical protein [Candidatus Pacearchaeota archaeon]